MWITESFIFNLTADFQYMEFYANVEYRGSIQRIRLFSSDLEALSDCSRTSRARNDRRRTRQSQYFGDVGANRGRSKFDKAGNLLFRTRLRSSPRRRLLIFILLPAFPRTSVHLLRFSTRPTLLIFGEGGILRLLFSFIKYTDPRRDSILLGGLLFVVPSPSSVTGSGSALLSLSLFSLCSFFSSSSSFYLFLSVVGSFSIT